MAKIKLKFGENEIEIESRDFYVDNKTLGEVIQSVTTHMEENRARIIYDEKFYQQTRTDNQFESNVNYLRSLENSEIHEPEYN